MESKFFKIWRNETREGEGRSPGVYAGRVPVGGTGRNLGIHWAEGRFSARLVGSQCRDRDSPPGMRRFRYLCTERTDGNIFPPLTSDREAPACLQIRSRSDTSTNKQLHLRKKANKRSSLWQISCTDVEICIFSTGW